MVQRKLYFKNMKLEEEWINSHNIDGYCLMNVNSSTGRYEFEQKKEQGFVPITKMDYRLFPTRDEYRGYLATLDKNGWVRVGGTKNSGFQYFNQKTNKSKEDAFQNRELKTEQLKRLSTLLLNLFVIYVACMIILDQFNIISLDHLFEISAFTVDKGVIGFLFLAILILYFISTIGAKYYYKKEITPMKETSKTTQVTKKQNFKNVQGAKKKK